MSGEDVNYRVDDVNHGDDLPVTIAASVEDSPTNNAIVLAVAPPTSSDVPLVQTTEDEDNSSIIDMPELFSLRRPKDIGGGLASGLKSFGKGLAAGVAGLVTAPVVGFKAEGAVGAAKGVGLGLLGAVALPLAGACVGGVQVVRGAMNTPEAIRQSNKETRSKWDKKKREWIENYRFSLDEDWQKYRDRSPPEPRYPEGSALNQKSITGSKNVRDTSLYEMLVVTPEATPQEITKAYHRKARQLHPDRNKEDPEATQKFQDLSKAYQVLSDPARRQKYDREGLSAASDDGDKPSNPLSGLSASVFFNVLLAVEELEEFIGQPKLGTLLETVGNTASVVDNLTHGAMRRAEENAEEEMPQQPGVEMAENLNAIVNFIEKKRALQLAVQLRTRLQPWRKTSPSEGSSALMQRRVAFLAAFREEIKTLVREGGSAARLLHSVGFSYVNYSEQWLGRDTFFQRARKIAKTHETVHNVKTFVKAGAKAASALSQAGKMFEEMRNDVEKHEKAQKEYLERGQKSTNENPSPATDGAASNPSSPAEKKPSETSPTAASTAKSPAESTPDHEEGSSGPAPSAEQQYPGMESEMNLEGADVVLSAVIGLAESYSLGDAAGVSKQAVKYVLKNDDESKEARIELANGILELGKVIMEESKLALKAEKKRNREALFLANQPEGDSPSKPQLKSLGKLEKAAKEAMMAKMTPEEKEAFRAFEEAERQATGSHSRSP